MVKRSRLRRGASAKKDSRLKLEQMVGKLSTAQLESYSSLKSDDPIAELLRNKANSEIARRDRVLQRWGVAAVEHEKPKKPAAGLVAEAKKLVAEAAKVLGGGAKAAGEGAKMMGKVMSGDLELDIATAGMKPAEKKRYIAQRKAEMLKREKAEAEEVRKMGAFEYED